MWFTDPPQPAQQKLKINMGLSRKDLWKNLLPHGINSKTYTKRPTRFLRILYKQNQFGTREPVVQKKDKGSFPQAENRLIKLFSSKYMLPFREKIKDNFNTNLEGRTRNHVDHSQVLNTMPPMLLIQNCLGLGILFSTFLTLE